METQVEVGKVRVEVGWPERRDWTIGLTPTPSDARCALLWRDLLRGNARIVAQHSDETHHYFELVPTLGVPLPPRELRRWLPTLLGDLQKVVAVDEHLAVSTVACAAARCLKLIGLSCTAKETPMLLVIMAHIGERYGTERVEGGEVLRFARSIVVKTRRPDLLLPATLTRSETHVIKLRIDGLSHERIASLRATSPRTIANQLASVYTKLGVSSRAELLANLASATYQPHSRWPLSPQRTVAA